MKKFLFVFLLALNQTYSYSQEVIRVSPDVELKRISKNALVHISYTNLPDYGRTSANGLIYINGNEALLFDTPWNDSLTEVLVSYLRDQMKLKIMGFVPNHWHEDCMGGISCLKSMGIKTYANQLTIEIAKNKGLDAAETGFNDSLMLDLGGRQVYCYFPGAAHSKDNIVVWIPSEKILFTGCICKSTSSTNLGNVADGDLSQYPKTIDFIIQKFKPSVVIPGHGQIGGPELLTHTRSLIPRQ